MMKSQRKTWTEFNHHIAFISFLGAAFSLILVFRYNQQAQSFVVILAATTYTLWGILHHKLSHYLTREIIFEYILVSAIGALVLLSLIGY